MSRYGFGRRAGYGARRGRWPRSRAVGCLLWVVLLIVLLIVLSTLFGGFQKGTKVNGLGPVRAPVAVARAAGGVVAGHQHGPRRLPQPSPFDMESAMSLVLSDGPLSGRPPETVNYRLEGPAHKLLMHPFPRRVRAAFGGQSVLDTTRAMLLHETGLLPQLYAPLDDIRAELLQPTEHHTYCPFKGTASYWSVAVGGQRAKDAIWSYPEPNAESAWLRGYAGFYWGAMDEWYDEDELVEGRLRDPYHRVDVRRSSRRVGVLLGDTVLAETSRPLLLSETGLPNRFYLPAVDVRQDLLEASDTHRVCPYKGTASYWSIRAGDRKLTDAVWSYPQAQGDASDVSGYLCFGHEELVTVVGQPG
jgi:uncharacterized protein (DUF427 family)